MSTVLADDDDAASVAQACLHHPSIKRTKVLNGGNILFVMDNKEMYNNVLPRQCPGMRRNATLSYTYSNNSDICAGSTVTVLQRVGIGSNTVAYTDPATNQHMSLPAPAFVPTFVCPIGLFVPITEDELDLIVAATAEQERERRQRRRSKREAIETESVDLAPSADAAAPARAQP
jgi:hypothetical protein